MNPSAASPARDRANAATRRAWLSRAVERLGGVVQRQARPPGDAIYLLANALSGFGDLFSPTGFHLRRTIVQQLYFTAVQAFWLVNLIGIALGILVILPLIGFGITDVETQARVIQLALFHQLVPILAALVVIGRSGTAVTAEIGDLNQSGAVDSLLTMGIEPHRFIVLPRLLGLTGALLLLAFWGNVAAIVGAGVFNSLRGHASFGNFAAACAATLSPVEIVFTGLMVLCFGVFIALVHCHYGLRSASSVEVQRNLPKAFVGSLLAVIGITVLFVAVRP
jgi:phospholipid/cholesterol/gamma-HCH transport system permease protein